MFQTGIAQAAFAIYICAAAVLIVVVASKGAIFATRGGAFFVVNLIAAE